MSIVSPPDPEHGVCKKTVSSDSWHFRECGRPAVEQGMCARHLAGQRRSQRMADSRLERDRRISQLRDNHERQKAANWLELHAPEEATGSRDFGRGYMHAVRLLRDA